MSLKWTRNHNDSGILRKKSDYKEKKEELFIFGYTCKLFRDDEKALHIDQGKHLIPWMGDHSLKIDRYDARGALHDLSVVEAPPGGYDYRVELTRAELDVEQLCDEERYRALHTDEDEEEMYREEELKRLHAAGYGQVGFNYESSTPAEPVVQPQENDEPFVAAPSLLALLPPNVVLPETEKLNAIIDKTAKFIANQGAQMEILLRAKQADNPQFKFLSNDSPLYPYYMALSGLVKAGKWPEKVVEPVVEEKPMESDEYLHPSLGPAVIESAPSIPSIQYRPSADCDYTMLISKMKGEPTLDEVFDANPAPGELPPPGTIPLDLPKPNPDIQKGPVLYNQGLNNSHEPSPPLKLDPPLYPPPTPVVQNPSNPGALVAPSTVSTGLSLMKHYNSDSDSDESDSETSSNDSKPAISIPPPEIQSVIDKMAGYVARNGDEFAEIVRAKNDPRFTFLEPSNEYHEFYLKLMREKRGITNGETKKEKKDKKIMPVSFSIKKLKEPDPVLPKPALPYESSSEDESEKPTENSEESKEKAPSPKPSQCLEVPTAVVYKLEKTVNHVNPAVIEKAPQLTSKLTPVEKPHKTGTTSPKPITEAPVISKKIEVKRKSDTPERKREEKVKSPVERRLTPIVERKKTPDRYKDKYEYRSKSESKDYRAERVRDKKRYKESEVERKKKKKREDDIIDLDDEVMIDLTGDIESKDETSREKQWLRRARAAEFLRQAGLSTATATTTSLASAMVDTLETIRKKKEDEERRRRKEKKRSRYDHNGDREERSHKKYKKRRHEEESDHEGSRRKKKKKEKKHSSSSKSKRKRRHSSEEEEIAELPLQIDLVSTLKGLRESTPTKELGLLIEDTQQSSATKLSESDDDISTKRGKRKKEDREYSEGEWSSDSEKDSLSSGNRNSD